LQYQFRTLLIANAVKGKAMSSDADLIKLYSQRILALAAEITNDTRLDNPLVSVKQRAPLCGSTVTVDLDIEDGKISRFAQDVKACALGQAAASVAGRVMLGRTSLEIDTARDQLKTMLKLDGPVPDAPFEGLEVLIPARDYKNRHASILLCLEATSQAMEQAQKAACA
jgi:NifU-like protein involved in Fe-S cluster formation